MKSIHRLLLFISFIILLTSFSQAAVIYGGKVFHGDVFNSNIGGSFKIYGLEPYKYYNNVTGITELRYKKAFIMSNVDDTVSMIENQCESTNKYIYCYKGSSFDFNNPRTYEGAETIPSMSITIESLPSPTSLIVITRNFSIQHYCGEPITIPLTITNAGTIPTEIVYIEKMPVNAFISQIVGGIIDENTLTFKGRILENLSKEYSYTIINLDCKNKNWSATYSFTTYNSTLSRNLTGLSLQVLDTYKFVDSVSTNRTNMLTDEIFYSWNITNTHASQPIQISTKLYAPGIFVTDTSQGISHVGDYYVYSGSLNTEGKLNAYIAFEATEYGVHSIVNVGTISIKDHQFDYNSTESIDFIEPLVYPYMNIVATNTSLNISIFSKNRDLTEKYYYIYGILKGVTGEEVPMYANNINPDATLLLGTKYYNTTGSGLRNVTVVFDGVYRDKNSKEHKLHVEQIMTLNSPKIITTNENAVPVVNTTKNTTIKTRPVITAPKANNTNTNTTQVPKKDLITRMIDGLNSFLQSIFG